MLRGYARVSTEDQTTDPQLEELAAAGCDCIYTEHGSGASRARPELARLLREIAPGDTLVVVRLDRLARSVAHLLDVIEDLKAKSAGFRSLRDPIDTTTPQGEFTLLILGAVAQLERALISERTKAGLKVARAKGRIGGNPGLRSGDPAAKRKIAKAQARYQMGKLLAGLDRWLPVVKLFRPDHSWEMTARFLNRQLGQAWTAERLRRSVRRLVKEGLAEKQLLDPAPRRPPDDQLMILVASIKRTNPGYSLRAIAAELEGIGQQTPRGGTSWSASSVRSLLERAKRQGLMGANEL